MKDSESKALAERHREHMTRLARLEFLLSGIYCKLLDKKIPDFTPHYEGPRWNDKKQ